MTMVPERHMGAFHSMKNFDLDSRKFPETNGRAISGISGEEDNLARHTEIFSNYRSMTRFSEILQFPEFLEAFPGNYRTIGPRFEIFQIFGSMESAHMFIDGKLSIHALSSLHYPGRQSQLLDQSES